jgi:putative peptidoglycan lipid II flippase
MASAPRITLVNIFARAAHLLLFLAISNRFGASTATDTILLLQAPLLIVMSVSAGVADVIVMPAMHRALLSNSSITILNQFRYYALLAALPLSIIAVLIGSYISPKATLLMILIVLPMPLFSTLSSLHTGILNANNMHKRAAIGPLYGGLASIPLLFILPFTPESVALSLLLFELAKYTGLRLHSYPVIKKLKHQNKSDKALMTWAMKGAGIHAIGSFILAMNLLIDDLFASHLGQGSVSLIEYASRFWNVVPLLLIGNLTLAYANMSRMAANHSLERDQVHNTAIKLGLSALILSIIASIASHPIIQVAYSLGSMTTADQTILSTLINFYLIGAGPFLAGQVYVRAHSSMGNFKAMTIVASISILINTLGNILLIPIFGLNGIALATAISYTCNTLMLAYLFIKIS